MPSIPNTDHLTPYQAICDTILRNATGIDTNDVTLMSSAFTADANQDMTAFRFLDEGSGIISGRDAIVAMASSSVGKMDTTHMTSNFRVQVGEDGRSAHLTCYALAQHWRPGTGLAPSDGGNFLMGNKYDADLVFDGEIWRIKRLKIMPQWTQGDPSVFDPTSWIARP